MVEGEKQDTAGGRRGVSPAQVEDSTFWVTQLTERQRLYAAAYVEFEGDWKQAALKAGYSDVTPQSHIEEGPAMFEYMRLLKEEVALAAAVGPVQITRRLNAIALAAQTEKNYTAAIKANQLLGDMHGMFHKEVVPTHLNQQGQIINIINTRPGPPAPMDAATQAILERNGLSTLIPVADDSELHTEATPNDPA